MNEAKEILNQLPKSRDLYTTIRSAKLEALREIVACFEDGDAALLGKHFEVPDHSDDASDGLGGDLIKELKDLLDEVEQHGEIMNSFLKRMQKAAKLAEDLG